MLTFKNHQTLNEISLLGLYQSIVGKVKTAFASLGFGNKVSIKIPMPVQEKVDLKSRLGYFSEYATGAALAKIIQDHGGRLTPHSTEASMMKSYVQKKHEVESLGAEKSEVDRMASAGSAMASQIWNDIVMNGTDLPFLTFDIQLTGDSEKGVSKADLVLNITKDNEKVVVDKICASLKAYKSSAINLSNSTFISLIKTLFYDADANLPSRSEEFIIRFTKDYGSKADMNKLYGHQNIIGTLLKTGVTKDDARKEAKLTHGEVIELIAKIFRTYYPAHKKEINERMLKMLGFDGEDDFYAAIGEAGKQKVVSSRKSKELQAMLKKLSQDFTLTVARNGTTNNANILFNAPNGDIITKANITFADTGGASPQGKTNAFVNFKDFMR
jgi:hypothetical protein